jgi:hypothetical protein
MITIAVIAAVIILGGYLSGAATRGMDPEPRALITVLGAIGWPVTFAFFFLAALVSIVAAFYRLMDRAPKPPEPTPADARFSRPQGHCEVWR